MTKEQDGSEGSASLSTRQGHTDLTDGDSPLPLVQLMRRFTLRTAGWTQTRSTGGGGGGGGGGGRQSSRDGMAATGVFC